MAGDDVKWHGLAGVEGSGEEWTGTETQARRERERLGRSGMARQARSD